MRPDHKMGPLTSRDILTRKETPLDRLRHRPQTPGLFLSLSLTLLFYFFLLLLLSSFLVLNSRVNKQQVMPKCFRPKTEAKLLWENIWPLWFCNMFQNTEFTAEHCERLPSAGVMLGNVTVSQPPIGPFPAGLVKKKKKKKKKKKEKKIVLCGS